MFSSSPYGARRAKPAWLVDVVLLLAAIGVGVWARLHDLDAESIWLDEATTFERARFALDELVSNTVAKLHIPTYFVFMHYFLQLGDDEWMMRLPSALFGMAKLPLIAAAGWVVGGPRVAVPATLMLALAPAHIRYDQEARMYAMQTFGTCLALVGQVWIVVHPCDAVRCTPWAWLRGNDIEGSSRAARIAWLGWIAGVVLALYAHNTSALYLVAASCAMVMLFASNEDLRWRLLLHWVIANLVVLVLWAPWLPTLLAQTQTDRFVGRAWGGVPSVERVLKEASYLFLGARGAVPIKWLMLALGALGVWHLRSRRVLLVVLLLLAVMSPGLVWLISLKKPMFMPRILLWGGPAYYVLAACGVAALRWRAIQLVTLALLMWFGVQELDRTYYKQVIKTDWRRIAQELSTHTGPEVLVLTNSFKEERVLSYYAERHTDPFVLPRVVRADSWEARKRSAKLLAGKRDVYFTFGSRVQGTPSIIRIVEKRGRLLSEVHVEGGARLRHYALRSMTD